MAFAWAQGEAAPPSFTSSAIPWVAALSGLMLLACSFFSVSETALFSLQTVDREALREDPRIGPRLGPLLDQPRRLLATLLIGNELSNVGLSTASASVLLALAPQWPWLNIVVVAPVLILFGDVLPKTIGLRYSRPVVERVTAPLYAWYQLVRPIRWGLTGAVDLLLRSLGVRPEPQDEGLREEQIRTLIDEGTETGVIQPMEQEIIHRVFAFGDLPVSRLMTPRPDIFSRSITTPWPELLAAIREARYSRVPIWQGNPDNIVGVLLVKDLLRLRKGPPPNPRQLRKMLHPALFVPPTKPAKDLLREFRAQNRHLAVVVDEHGAVDGLITLDDLLTELVGELHDESDGDEAEVAEIRPNLWVVRGNMDIEDFGRAFDVELPDGDWTTLGGFVFHLLGTSPEKGAETSWGPIRFLVSGVDGRRITEVTVERLATEADAAAGEGPDP